MKTKLIKNILLIFCVFTVSCNYLDIVPDETPTVDHAFTDRYEAHRFLFGCFSYLPDFALPGSNPALLSGDEVWLIDPVNDLGTDYWNIARGLQGTNSPYGNWWSSRQDGGERGGKQLYTALRDCNIFLENIHKPYDLEEYERVKWIAEVKFLKAYFHFTLLRLYGPVPIIKENLPLGSDPETVQRYRDPVDDVVSYIVELLDEAVPDLPPTIDFVITQMGRPTQDIALAVKAQVLTLAASPLFNGNPDYTSLVDARGVQLFPDYDANKWTVAADALKAAIDAAHANRHRLYDFVEQSMAYIDTITPEVHKPTILSMQVRGAVTEAWNDEIIWGDPNSNTEQLQHACHPAFTPDLKSGAAALKCYAPPLHIVEQFYTKNGIPIEDDLEWVGVDLMGLRTATDDDKYHVRSGKKTINLHFDREARFYGAISFDNGVYFGGSYMPSDANLELLEFKNGTVGGGPMSPTRYPSTAYLCKKFLHILTQPNGLNLYSYPYPFPVIRLADLYLMYAEALNEAGGETPSSDVYAYVDVIRKRSGLKGVVESWQNYAIGARKNLPSTKTGMREIIQRERMNELAFEGARFWDLRRWKLAEDYCNRPIRGMNINGDNDAEFYRDTPIYQRPTRFTTKDYLWPIKLSVILNNKNIEQNPGWGGNW